MSGRSLALLPFLVLAAAPGLAAKTLSVGPDQELKLPSDAAKRAAPGDTIEIAPVEGGYFDCAVWRADDLVIEGQGDGVVITDKPCQGKALFIVAGKNITIRNLTFQRARVPDKNGAGIRAEGANLTVEGSRFVNNESGILAGNLPGSTLTIRDSIFSENGRCEGKCIASVAVDELTLLRIEHSRFERGAGGDAVKSLALRTELVGNSISGADAAGGAVMVELPAGGSLVMQDNTFELGRAATAAVAVIAPIGAHPVEALVATGNKVRLAGATDAVFIRDWTGTSVHLENNALDGGVTAVASDGYLWFYAKSSAHAAIANLRTLAAETLRTVRRLL